mgnify:CR=1 FL=1
MSGLVEINFDGIVGPTHNYAGPSPGNIASASHRGVVVARARMPAPVAPGMIEAAALRRHLVLTDPSRLRAGAQPPTLPADLPSSRQPRPPEPGPAWIVIDDTDARAARLAAVSHTPLTPPNSLCVAI